MVAGPNGSGKSTLLNWLTEQAPKQGFKLGDVLNPDLVQAELEGAGRLNFRSFGIRLTKRELESHVQRHPLRSQLRGDLPTVRGGTLVAPLNFKAGYFLPILSDFIRDKWMADRRSFTFETVMSDVGKVTLLSTARASGYRTYLYYICTEAVAINQARIATRVASGGHDVPEEKIEARYERSRALLLDASRAASRAYIFDNSETSHRLVAEFDAGRLTKIFEPIPNWFSVSILDPLNEG